jgi:hypothetical protein
MKRAIIAIFFVLSFVMAVLAEDTELALRSATFDTLPAPQLEYPVTEQVILTGKDFLEFKWWNDFMGIDHFIFRIYKGYNMYESGLFYKQNLPADESSVKIKSDLFKDSQVYTWSLIQVSFSGQKSDKSFNSFKVIKK